MDKKLLWGTLAIFLVLSQFVIFIVDREAWFDTSFSLETVNAMREGKQIDFAAWDVHPPVFYFSLYYWSFLNPGMSEYHWAQELSVLFGLIFFIFAYLSFSKLFGKQGEIAIFLLMACSTYVHYGTEPRSYALILAMSAILLYCVIRNFEKGWMTATSLVIAFTFPLVHYYAAAVALSFFGIYIIIKML